MLSGTSQTVAYTGLGVNYHGDGDKIYVSIWMESGNRGAARLSHKMKQNALEVTK